MTLAGSNGSAAAVERGTAAFPVDKALYNAVDSRGKDVTVTLSGGVTTETQLIVSPKTYGPGDVPPDGPGTDKYYIAKPVGSAPVYDLSVASGRETLSDLDGGSVQVTIPYGGGWYAGWRTPETRRTGQAPSGLGQGNGHPAPGP